MLLPWGILGKNCGLPFSIAPCSCLCPSYTSRNLSYFLQAMPVLAPVLAFISSARWVRGHSISPHLHDFALPNGEVAGVQRSLDAVWTLRGQIKMFGGKYGLQRPVEYLKNIQIIRKCLVVSGKWVLLKCFCLSTQEQKEFCKGLTSLSCSGVNNCSWSSAGQCWDALHTGNSP